eukprot:GDKH01021898.1.p1 GENE.GDKH01021898.1~~GDKH01021898.1.p1  ORF type:complete len:207 (+),score=12.12 GDKH01021898.1:186-806(+)
METSALPSEQFAVLGKRRACEPACQTKRHCFGGVDGGELDENFSMQEDNVADPRPHIEKLRCLPQEAKDVQLISSAAAGDNAGVIQLISAGANPMHSDTFLNKAGWTALHHAAANGCTATVRLLLDRGSDPLALDKHDNLPIMLAAQNGHLFPVMMLCSEMSRNAWNSPNHTTGLNGRQVLTATLALADRGGHTQISNWIRECGAL